jgi:hypothetical protein
MSVNAVRAEVGAIVVSSGTLRLVRGVRGIAAFLAGLVLIVAAGIFVLYLLDRPADEAAAVVGLVVGILAVFGALVRWLHWLWRQSHPTDVSRPSTQQVDDLAAAVRRQWEEEATRRKLVAPAPLPVRWTLAALELRGPNDGAVELLGQPRRYETLPGLDEITGQSLRSGGGRAELYRLYGSFPSGRLVITGEPGAGKTGTGIMLLLDALAHRARLSDHERGMVPVPVMFTLADWDPNTTSFEHWLGEKLGATYYPGRSGRKQAKALVDNNQIAAIVDGLDEIKADLRPIALEAMSAARVRLVLFSRTQEMGIAAREHRLIDAAVLELCAVDAAVAADYLNRSLPGQPPAHWDDLLDQLRSKPEGHLARALQAPLTLTLVRDTYRAGDDVSDLLDATHTGHSRAIEEHVLDRIIGAAYTPRLGDRPPAYPVDVAERALLFIAERMDHAGTRDFAWWQLHRWAPRWPRLLARTLPIGLVLIGLAVLEPEALFPLALFAAWGAIGYRMHGRGPHRIGRPRWRTIVSRRFLAYVPPVFLAGLLLGLLIGLPEVDLLAGIRVGLAVGISGGFAIAFVQGLRQAGSDVSAPVTPVALWRGDRRAAILFGLALGLAATLGLVLLASLLPASTYISISPWEVLIVVSLLLLASAVGGWLSSMAVTTRLAISQLAIGNRVPMRLIHFLEDARRREVLRTVGPVYQFRHARLQDRLAVQHRLNTAKTPKITVPDQRVPGER